MRVHVLTNAWRGQLFPNLVRALFLTRHSAQGPSTRYRALQFVPHLTERGWSVEWHALLPSSYLQGLYDQGKRPLVDVCTGYLGRLAYLWSTNLRAFDVVYVQSELFPYLPYCLESLLIPKIGKTVFDFDDAVFAPYERFRMLRNKIPAVLRAAQEVIVGNDTLYDYARLHNEHVSIIPTVVDLSRYEPKSHYQSPSGAPFVIGWIGTPVTVRYLASLGPVLQRIARVRRIVVRCIGTPMAFAIPGVTVENVAWCSDTEASLIREFDVGVMPLADEPFAHGKCGLKLIQYMAAGVPAVGARLGANTAIVDHGINGFLASTEEEYIAVIEQLITNQDLRERIGRAGRATVESRYSLQARAEEFCNVLERAALAEERNSKFALVHSNE